MIDDEVWGGDSDLTGPAGSVDNGSLAAHWPTLSSVTEATSVRRTMSRSTPPKICSTPLGSAPPGSSPSRSATGPVSPPGSAGPVDGISVPDLSVARCRSGRVAESTREETLKPSASWTGSCAPEPVSSSPEASTDSDAVAPGSTWPGGVRPSNSSWEPLSSASLPPPSGSTGSAAVVVPLAGSPATRGESPSTDGRWAWRAVKGCTAVVDSSSADVPRCLGTSTSRPYACRSRWIRVSSDSIVGRQVLKIWLTRPRARSTALRTQVSPAARLRSYSNEAAERGSRWGS
ncbi:hypothetical protein SAMN04489717_1102 [Actinopolymorpha singaporensis]|uniref:Uncharacterized protein n=1 Tax=Actinopolymorpha singaporensis TaxID=117157 RepID=A0A1H1N5J7_9ACTN|nr:hypothetical protein SAMN04489717_1102 [Actinopolymorpha singaporensis]